MSDSEGHLRRYSGIYRVFYCPKEFFYKCFYCGCFGAEYDHCPPMSRVDDYRALNLPREEYIQVLACRECNSLLGSSLQNSLVDRLLDVRTLLKNRYSKELSMPKWSKREKMELGKNLRRAVQHTALLRKQLEIRLTYCDGLNAYLNSKEK